jgi:hypothetical protein
MDHKILTSFDIPSNFDFVTQPPQSVDPIKEPEVTTETKNEEENKPVFGVADATPKPVVKTQVPDIVNDEQEAKPSVLKILAEDFAEKGFIELPEDFDGSDEAFNSAYETTLDKKANQKIIDAFESHPQKEDAIELFNYIKEGGDINEFMNYKQDPLYGIDITKVEDQEKVYRLYLKNTTKLSDERINEKIERHKDAATLESEATDAYDALKDLDKEVKEKTKTNQEMSKKAQEESRIKAVNEAKEFISKSESIKGVFDIKGKREKEDFMNYLFKPTVRIGNQTVAQAYADDVNEDLESYLAVQYLKFKKFNLSDVKKSAKNETITTLADKLSKAWKDNARTKGSGGVKEENYENTQSLSRDEINRNWEDLVLKNKIV